MLFGSLWLPLIASPSLPIHGTGPKQLDQRLHAPLTGQSLRGQHRAQLRLAARPLAACTAWHRFFGGAAVRPVIRSHRYLSGSLVENGKLWCCFSQWFIKHQLSNNKRSITQASTCRSWPGLSLWARPNAAWQKAALCLVPVMRCQ